MNLGYRESEDPPAAAHGRWLLEAYAEFELRVLWCCYGGGKEVAALLGWNNSP